MEQTRADKSEQLDAKKGKNSITGTALIGVLAVALLGLAVAVRWWQKDLPAGRIGHERPISGSTDQQINEVLTGMRALVEAQQRFNDIIVTGDRFATNMTELGFGGTAFDVRKDDGGCVMVKDVWNANADRDDATPFHGYRYTVRAVVSNEAARGFAVVAAPDAENKPAFITYVPTPKGGIFSMLLHPTWKLDTAEIHDDLTALFSAQGLVSFDALVKFKPTDSDLGSVLEGFQVPEK